MVVRSDLTGSTHLFEPLAAEVLHTLMHADAALTVDELAARIAGKVDAPGEWVSSIEAILSEFQRLGLVEPSG